MSDDRMPPVRTRRRTWLSRAWELSIAGHSDAEVARILGVPVDQVCAALTYARRRAAGQCVAGGCNRPAVAGRTRCREHLRRSATQLDLRRREFRDSRKCLNCGAERDGRWVLCRACRQRQREAMRRLRQARATAGLCVWCGAPAASGRRYCRACLDRAAARMRDRKGG